MNAYTLFARAFAGRLAQPVLEDEGGSVFTYADLDRETARIASYLAGLGLRRGDRVAAQIEKSPQGLFLYLATLRAGLCFLPLNTAYQKTEIAYFLNDAEPAVFVCDPARAQGYREIAAQARVAHLLTLDSRGAGSLADGVHRACAEFSDAVLADDDLAVIIYTSGTTGRSKGAMVTHGNLTSNAAVLKDSWRIGESDVLIHALPVFHVHGLFVAVHPLLLAGARMIFLRKFDPKAVLAAMRRATMLMGVPTFYVRLLGEAGLTLAAVSGMRLFVSGSAPLLLDTFAEWRARTGCTILERYGMSEAGMIASNPYDGERRGGTVGFALSGVSLRVAGADDKPLGAGEPGAIQIKGPNVFAGYWRMPEKTREEFTADGWFRTGDVGQWSEDGYLSIVGRAKDLIISGGYNVYPKEIELVVDAIPGVVESAVVGIAHPNLGEAVTAVVVRAKGAALSEADVIARVKAEIAGFKVPKLVRFVAELPRNAMGKVQKSVLREQLGRERSQ